MAQNFQAQQQLSVKISVFEDNAHIHRAGIGICIAMVAQNFILWHYGISPVPNQL